MKFRFQFIWFCLLLATFPTVAQSISGFTPMVGSPGDIVRISGDGFYPGTLVVKFNNKQDPTAEATDYTHIQAAVPATATTGRISVQVNGGTTAFSAQDFTVVGPGPYITNFFPIAGSAATPTAPGTAVTIKGLHFREATAAYFNGRLAANFNPSDNQIQVTVPAGATSGPLTVMSPLGTNTTTANFFVTPVVTGFSPAAGRTGTNVIITGTNFLGTLDVLFNGTAANFIVLSNRALQVIVPTNASTGQIMVDTPAGGFPSPSNFVVRPTIYSFSPAFGAAHTNVILTGANFNAGSRTVYFNGLSATVSGVSFGQLTATVPDAATTGFISITTIDGSHTNLVPFYITATITSFVPSNAPAGAWVKITGQNFTGASGVSFGGVAATTFVVTNNTTIGALVPIGAVTAPITVTTPAGSVSSATLFFGAPVITGFSPTHGLPGTNVTIYGTNLLGATAVRFNGLDAGSIVATNNGFIRATVPASAQAGPITVVAPGGTITSLNNFILDYSDLGVNSVASPVPIFVGSNLTYTVTVTNSGPADAVNLRFTESLPAGVTLISANPGPGTIITNTSPITGTLPALSVGGTWTIGLTIRPNLTGYITNVATITSDYLDTASANNSVTTVNNVLPLPILSIQWVTNSVRLSWPLALSNLSLATKTGLASTNYWSNVIAAVSRTTNANVVTQAVTGPLRVYRLKE